MHLSPAHSMWQLAFLTSTHNPLISALNTYYKLLVDIRSVPESRLAFPSTDTGRHPSYAINNAAAAEHGFSNAIVDLTYQLPYITDNSLLTFETDSLSYLVSGANDEEKQLRLADGEGEEPWEWSRDPTYQERRHVWGGKNILVLTHGNAFGTELLYNLDEHTIIEWNHFNDPPWQEMPAYPMTSSQNPLYVWIKNTLSLRYIVKDNNILVPDGDVSPSWRGDEPSPSELKSLVRELKERDKEKELQGVYVRFGWNIDAFSHARNPWKPIWENLELARQKAVENFRADKFEERREQWEEEVRAIWQD